MKKLKFTILGLIICSTTAFAQFDLGVMNGMHATYADYEPNDPLSQTTYLIPQFGLFAKYALTDNLALQFSPSLSANRIEANYWLDIELRSGYLDLPILLSYEVDLGMFKPYVFVGPSLGIIINPRSITYSFGKVEEDISEDVADINYSVKGGLGLELEFKAFSFFGQMYFSYGLNDLYTPPDGITFPEDVYLRSIGIQGGISFPLGG